MFLPQRSFNCIQCLYMAVATVRIIDATALPWVKAQEICGCSPIPAARTLSGWLPRIHLKSASACCCAKMGAYVSGPSADAKAGKASPTATSRFSSGFSWTQGAHQIQYALQQSPASVCSLDKGSLGSFLRLFWHIIMDD